MKIILGQGSWGKRLKHEFEKEDEVRTWTHTQDAFEIKDTDQVYIAIPAPYLIETLNRFTHSSRHATVWSATKGLTEHGLLPSDAIRQAWASHDIIIMGGACIASEPNLEIIEVPFNRQDQSGVFLELAGILKNVYAIGFNIVRSRDGDNMAAAWFVKAWAELKGQVKEERYLSDLVTTCMSDKSRNCRAGKLIAEHKVLDFGHQVAEGVHSAKVIKKYNLFPHMVLLRETVEQID